jgi:NO-binding membrane sensor protein with MHYT domain
MGTFEPSGTYGAVAFFALLCACAAYNAFDAYRLRERRRSLRWLALTPVFAGLALATFHFANTLSMGSPWGGISLGTGWECSVAPAAARVCFKDVPPALERPKEAPTHPGG